MDELDTGWLQANITFYFFSVYLLYNRLLFKRMFQDNLPSIMERSFVLVIVFLSSLGKIKLLDGRFISISVKFILFLAYADINLKR